MQNGQTEPKVYVYTPQALFVHSKKNIKKEKPIGFSTANYLQPLSHCVTAPLTQGSRFLRDYYLLFLFVVGAIFIFEKGIGKIDAE